MLFLAYPQNHKKGKMYMKKFVVFSLIVGFLLIICGCSNGVGNSGEAQVPTSSTAPKSIVSEAQSEAIEKTARYHLLLDYGFSFDSITFNSLNDDGTYITVVGEVVFVDDNNNKYTGVYSVTLVEKNDVDQEYKTVSWTLDDIKGSDGKPLDYFAMLYDYIVENGIYDSSNKYSYIEKLVARNEYYYLIAENGTLRFWDFAYYENSSEKFYLSYESVFSKNSDPTFAFDYGDYDLRNGIAIGGEYAHVSGTINIEGSQLLTISSEDYFNCSDYDIYKSIKESQQSALKFIEQIMNDAGIKCTIDQLLSAS